ncbi:unnamed protein product [Arabidopsis halleri]
MKEEKKNQKRNKKRLSLSLSSYSLSSEPDNPPPQLRTPQLPPICKYG